MCRESPNMKLKSTHEAHPESESYEHPLSNKRTTHTRTHTHSLSLAFSPCQEAADPMET